MADRPTVAPGSREEYSHVAPYATVLYMQSACNRFVVWRACLRRR